MSEPLLALSGVTRAYPSGDKTLEVLKGVDLQLMPGQMVGLVGPSGSGKSSLLHSAGLLERPDGGKVTIGGKDVSRLSDRVRTRLRLHTIGFVYQFHHLLPEFSALDNVAIPGQIAGMNRRAARARAEELLVQLGLAERMTHQPSQMSGGEQQRVAIARALVNRPRVLLADEPTGNLDPTTSTSVFQNLFDLCRADKVAALIATHNMQLAGYMDEVYGLKDGQLVLQPRN